MSTKHRLLQALASLILLLALAFPLWTISLSAPQYPEGIGLRIWAWQITGQKEQDLRNINGLNHYIGMKTIEPDSIPELRILPPVIVGFGLLGLAVAALGKRRLLGAWLALLVVGGLVGLADFWKWEYDYGHDLDPHAAIQVPGMSYQPPLIGTKQLLNMRTTALPGVGGLAVLLSLGLGAFVFQRSGRVPAGPAGGRNPEPAAHKPVSSGVGGVLALLPLLLIGCGGPRPIDYGTDACARCRMFVVDDRHGAELVTKRGRVLVFDSVECLAAHMHNFPEDAQQARAALVTHTLRPGQLVDAATSHFLHCEALPSPMGLGLSACATASEAESLRSQHGGQVLDWAAVQDHVRREWSLR